VVDGSGEGVAAEKPGGPRGALEEVQRDELDGEPEEDLVFGGGVDAHVFFEGGVRGEDLGFANAVRLGGWRPEEMGRGGDFVEAFAFEQRGFLLG